MVTVCTPPTSDMFGHRNKDSLAGAESPDHSVLRGTGEFSKIAITISAYVPVSVFLFVFCD